MKYNYPIKFAAMPIVEQFGWAQGLNELERQYHVTYYVASKCYLLSDETKYSEFGKSEKRYEVVFPYQQKNNHFERVTPSFNLYNHACINSNYVSNVFNSYEEALKFTNDKNKQLWNKFLTYVPSIEEIKEFQDKLSKYKMLEQQILANSTDLDQNHVKQLSNIIQVNKSTMQVRSMNLYEYLAYCPDQTFTIYSISSGQYNKLITKINNKMNMDTNISKIVKNARPILYHEEKDENIMLLNQNGFIINYINKWNTLENKINVNMANTPVNITNEEVEKVLTTETFDDIIFSFQRHKSINLDEIRNPVLKKTISKTK